MWWANVIPILRELTPRVGSLRQKGCVVNEARIIPCLPGVLAMLVMDELKREGLLPPGGHLSTEVYGVARNVAGEVGTGKGSTPSEKIAIAEAAHNRARLDGKTILGLLLKDGKWFGRQRGRNPAVATTADPTIEEIFAAQIVARGKTGNFARGATHYFDPITQDIKHREDPVNYTKGALDLYDGWTQSDGMAWVGPLPGINPRKLFLLRKHGRGYTKTRAWRDAYEAGRKVILRQSSGLAGHDDQLGLVGFGFGQAQDPAAIFRAAFEPANGGKVFFVVATGIAVAGAGVALALRSSRR